MDKLLGWILVFTAAANAASAILAWVSKIRWSAEYRQAKEARIDELKERIDTLERLNPKMFREWYGEGMKFAQDHLQAVRNQLEMFKTDKERLESEGQEKDKQLQEARKTFDKLTEDVREMESKLALNQVPDFATLASSADSSRVLALSTDTPMPASEIVKIFDDPSWEVIFPGDPKESWGVLDKSMKKKKKR